MKSRGRKIRDSMSSSATSKFKASLDYIKVHLNKTGQNKTNTWSVRQLSWWNYAFPVFPVPSYKDHVYPSLCHLDFEHIWTSLPDPWVPYLVFKKYLFRGWRWNDSACKMLAAKPDDLSLIPRTLTLSSDNMPFTYMPVWMMPVWMHFLGKPDGMTLTWSPTLKERNCS